MKKIAVAMVFALMSIFCSLQVYTDNRVTISTAELNEQEVAELAAKAAQMRAAKGLQVAKEIATPDNLIKWSEAGAGLGKALAATAKELGVGADAFMSSRTGTIATGLIIYHFFGKHIIRMVFGIFMLFFLLGIWTYQYRRMCVIKSITIPESGKGKVIAYYDGSNERVNGDRIMMLVFLIAIVVIMSLIIFL